MLKTYVYVLRDLAVLTAFVLGLGGLVVLASELLN